MKPVQSGPNISLGCHDHDDSFEQPRNSFDVQVRMSPYLDDSFVVLRWHYYSEEHAQGISTRSQGPASVVLAWPKGQLGLCLETASMANDTGPNFDICFPPGPPNPAVKGQLQLREWLYSWLPTSIRAAQWRMIDRWQIPRFVELTYPTCQQPDDARLLVGWITWLHLFDDEFDRSPISHDRDAAEAFVAPFLHCISELGSGRGPSSSGASDLLQMFADLNNSTVQPMSSMWRERWFDDLHSYIRACVVETSNRAAGVILTPEDLLQLKRACMAQRPVINLLERVATKEMSPEVFRLVSPVVDILSDITGSVNDPISLARERSRGDTHNMIISLTEHRLMTESEAIVYLVQFVRRRCNDMADAIRTIPNNPSVRRERENVVKWLTSCGEWARGYHDWLLETRRYKMSSVVSEAFPAAEPVV